MRPELEEALRLANELHRDDLPRLLGDIEEVRATASARLASPSAPPQPDQLLDVEEAAATLGLSADYLYHHHKQFPFTRRIGKRLLFSQNGVEKYLRGKKVA
jgi:predicted DNA-binding transcriptional regulator AlpA